MDKKQKQINHILLLKQHGSIQTTNLKSMSSLCLVSAEGKIMNATVQTVKNQHKMEGNVQELEKSCCTVCCAQQCAELSVAFTLLLQFCIAAFDFVACIKDKNLYLPGIVQTRYKTQKAWHSHQVSACRHLAGVVTVHCGSNTIVKNDHITSLPVVWQSLDYVYKSI